MTTAAPAAHPDAPVLSVVIPLLNEEAVLDETYDCLKRHLDALGETYEIIFVDDGSTDRSRAILVAKALGDPAVRVVGLSRNFGHEMATTAGLQHARGRAAIVLDADLQAPPELIPQFLAHWRQGYHVVYGVRQQRKGETLLKKLTSFLFYRLMGRVALWALIATPLLARSTLAVPWLREQARRLQLSEGGSGLFAVHPASGSWLWTAVATLGLLVGAHWVEGRVACHRPDILPTAALDRVLEIHAQRRAAGGHPVIFHSYTWGGI